MSLKLGLGLNQERLLVSDTNPGFSSVGTVANVPSGAPSYDILITPPVAVLGDLRVIQVWARDTDVQAVIPGIAIPGWELLQTVTVGATRKSVFHRFKQVGDTDAAITCQITGDATSSVNTVAVCSTWVGIASVGNSAISNTASTANVLATGSCLAVQFAIGTSGIPTFTLPSVGVFSAAPRFSASSFSSGAGSIVCPALATDVGLVFVMLNL